MPEYSPVSTVFEWEWRGGIYWEPFSIIHTIWFSGFMIKIRKCWSMKKAIIFFQKLILRLFFSMAWSTFPPNVPEPGSIGCFQHYEQGDLMVSFCKNVSALSSGGSEIKVIQCDAKINQLLLTNYHGNS